MRFSWVTENFLLKIFSLVVALVIFLFVSVESATPVDVEFPIEYRLDTDMVVVGDSPAVLYATMQGPWASFRSFGKSDLRPVIIDLTKMPPGAVRHMIETAELQPPGGMKVVSVRPVEVEVTLDRQVERPMPVEVDIIDRPAFGFEILAVRAEPAQVRVVGPHSLITKQDFIRTRPVNVGKRETDINLEIELRQPAPGVRLVDRKVKVLVEIAEEYVQRTFTNVAVVIDNGVSGIRAVPDVVPITIKGPRRYVDNLERKTLQAFVDVAEEVAAGRRSAEKAVALRGAPERTVLVDPAPLVNVQLPRKARRK